MATVIVRYAPAEKPMRTTGGAFLSRSQIIFFKSSTWTNRGV